MTGAHAPGWGELDRRTTATTAVWMVGVAVTAGVPIATAIAGASSLSTALLWVIPAAALMVVTAAVADELRRRRTRYRITPDKVELENGILFRRRRVLHRDRIRTVDITADPVARAFGLVKVSIGSGEQSAGTRTLTLQYVAAPVGDRLRGALLARSTAPTDKRSLARLDPSWIRFAPLSFATPVLGFAAAGAVMQGAEWLGMSPEVVGWIGDLFDGVPIVVMILALVALSQVVGLIGSLGFFVEMWWQYRLDREPGGTLRVRRGLFTTRSISVEERRLRGVEIVEPIGSRFAGAARVDAVATGMTRPGEDKGSSDHHVLLPAAPRGFALRVATEILRDPELWSRSATLRPHPRAAGGRRVRWALLTVLAFETVLVALGVWLTDVLLHIAWVSALVLIPTALLLAVDAYRGLGHAVSGNYLVTRSGTVRRATVALHRRGIIGWTVRQSLFQRRVGLITIVVTTAAGSGAYRIIDVDESEGVAFIESALPHLFVPFLDQVPSLPDRPVLMPPIRR